MLGTIKSALDWSVQVFNAGSEIVVHGNVCGKVNINRTKYCTIFCSAVVITVHKQVLRPRMSH